MMRKNINHKPISQHQKKQKSQDTKPSRIRKQNISSSPLYRQLLLNKQNIHPNKNAPSHPIIPCVIMSPVRHLATDNTLGVDKYREEYYQIKQNRYNSRQIKLHLNNNALSNANQLNIANSCIDVRQTIHDEQLKAKSGVAAVDTRINSHSLQKCRMHEPSQYCPVVQFLVQKPDKKQLLLCQNCACQYRNKISVQRLTNTQINSSKPSLTVSSYFNMLSNKIQFLNQVYDNLLKAEQQFLRQSSQQSEKHRKYYNSVLEIIEEAMQKSEEMFSKWVREGESAIRNKKQQIENVLKMYNCEMKKLLQFQQRSINLSPIQNIETKFNIQVVAQDYNPEITLPVLGIYTQIPGIMQNFKTNFNQNYSIKMLTQSELDQNLRENNNLQILESKTTNTDYSHNLNVQAINPNSIPRNNYLSPTARNSNSSNSNTNHYADDGDLFCHEDIDTEERDPNNSNSGSCHNFSFDKSQGSALPKNQCIVELVDQEDVISPVFKAI